MDYDHKTRSISSDDLQRKQWIKACFSFLAFFSFLFFLLTFSHSIDFDLFTAILFIITSDLTLSLVDRRRLLL
jgi:hypothetical protein